MVRSLADRTFQLRLGPRHLRAPPEGEDAAVAPHPQVRRGLGEGPAHDGEGKNLCFFSLRVRS